MAIEQQPRLTETQEANYQFLERIQQIAGVVQVEPNGGETAGEQTIIVYIQDGNVDAEYRVYELKGELYERYPGARLVVSILEESDAVAAEENQERPPVEA